MKRLAVLAVYPFGAGLEQAFRKRGHLVYTVDFTDKRDYKVDAVVSPEGLATWVPPRIDGGWDIAFCRPYCTTYSRASFFMHYRDHRTGQALTAKAHEADEIVCNQMRIAADAKPRLGWVLENPDGDLKKCAFMAGIPMQMVTLCQYGFQYRKATDLFGKIPVGFIPQACKVGANCHIHNTFMRGLDGKQIHNTPLLRASLPFNLSATLCEAFEAVA